MHTLVILKAVRDPNGLTVNRRAQKVFINREQFIFNPSDRNALEAALRLGGEVTVAAFGGAPDEQLLREARAMGASRAIHLNDPALAMADALVLANVLARVVQHLGQVDVIVTGAEALDSDLAQVGPRLAEALGRPFIGEARELTLEGAALQAIVARGRAFHRLETDLPVVASIARDSNRPRYAPAAAIITFFSDAKALEVLSLADLGLDGADLQPVTEPRGESFPPERTLGRRLEGDVVAQLIGSLGHLVIQ